MGSYILLQAPEVLRNAGNFCPASDIFSLGVILWQLITLEDPWADMLDVYVIKNVPEGDRLEWPHASEQVFSTYADLRKLVERCWENDPADRPTIDVKPQLLFAWMYVATFLIEIMHSSAGTGSISSEDIWV